MEISNLLNKKSSTDKESQVENESAETHITKKEISLPILCNDSNGNAMMTSDKQGSKLAQGSPAIARIAPQRAQISKAVKLSGFSWACNEFLFSTFQSWHYLSPISDLCIACRCIKRDSRRWSFTSSDKI